MAAATASNSRPQELLGGAFIPLRTIAARVAVGFAAINSGANLLHVLFGCQIGLILASGVLSENMVQRARVHRRASSALHVGERGALTVEVRNPDRRGDLISVSVEDDDRVEARGRCEPVFVVAVASGAEASGDQKAAAQELALPLALSLATGLAARELVRRLPLRARPLEAAVAAGATLALGAAFRRLPRL